MNTRITKTVIAALLLLSTNQSSFSQPFFINLDFESPVLPLVPDIIFQVSASDAMPGWTGYIGGNQVNRVVYNTVSLGAAAISLQTQGGFITPYQGNFSVVLQPTFHDGAVTAAIAQTGQIPQDARSITFLTGPATFLQVTFGGQSISLVAAGVGPNYVIKAGDISSFAGQIGELRFTGVAAGGGLPGGGGFLDNIQFSTNPIPEPRLLGLTALGVLLFLFQPKRREQV